MSDRDVEKLMEQVEKDVEGFTKSVDSQYRKATIRSAEREVEIEGYLKDLKTNAENMRRRFDSKYSASGEVLALLRQTQGIEARSRARQPLFGAESGWPRLRGSVERLGQEYGIDFSASPAGWQARRMNDDELKGVLESLEKGASPFKKELENATKKLGSLSKGERKAALENVDRLKETAKDLSKAVDQGVDPSGALALLASTVKDLETFVTRSGLSGSLASWAGLKGDLSKVNSAFHVGGTS
jgi:hypothetical protein